MNNTILDFAIIASGILGYFISISLVTTSFYKSRANNYLSISLFLLTSLTLLGRYGSGNAILEFLNFIMLDFLVAVTLFSYFLIQIEHRYFQKSWYKWLYLPFLSSLIIEIILHLDSVFNLFNSDFAVLIFYIKDNTSFVYNVLLIFLGRYLVKWTKTISEEKRRWLLRLNFLIVCIIASWLLSRIGFYIFNSEYAINFLWIVISFLSWWILYYGIFKLQVLVQKEEIHQYLVSKKKVNGARIKKKVNEATVSKIIAELYALMDEEELYKNPLLSRLDLATRLGTSEGCLSQIINQEINKSVIQFVNEYRIEAAKSLLHNPVFNKYSVEAIGMEAGFKSNSAFYNTFKTSLGMSPGAFRKLQKTS